MAKAGMEGAILNVRINLANLIDRDFVGKLTSEIENFKARGEALTQDILRTVDEKIRNG
jgi:formiminotetrahydrofolate cyclodeaminase